MFCIYFLSNDMLNQLLHDDERIRDHDPTSYHCWLVDARWPVNSGERNNTEKDTPMFSHRGINQQPAKVIAISALVKRNRQG